MNATKKRGKEEEIKYRLISIVWFSLVTMAHGFPNNNKITMLKLQLITLLQTYRIPRKITDKRRNIVKHKRVSKIFDVPKFQDTEVWTPYKHILMFEEKMFPMHHRTDQEWRIPAITTQTPS